MISTIRSGIGKVYMADTPCRGGFRTQKSSNSLTSSWRLIKTFISIFDDEGCSESDNIGDRLHMAMGAAMLLM